MTKGLKYALGTMGIFVVLVLAMGAGVAGSFFYMKYEASAAAAEASMQSDMHIFEVIPSLPSAQEAKEQIIYAPDVLENKTSDRILPESVSEQAELSENTVLPDTGQNVEPVHNATLQEPLTQENLSEKQTNGAPVPKAPVAEVLEKEPFEPEAPLVQTAPKPSAVLAIIVDDMGVNQRRTRDMLQLHGAFTSSFLTYGADLQKLVRKAQNAGHEVILHAAMEPKGPASLAPDTIKTSMDEKQIEALFQSMLDKFDGLNIKGVNNHMGSKFTENADKLAYVMNMIKAREMYFLDSKTTGRSKGPALALAKQVPFVERDVFLDNKDDYAYIRAKLDQAQNIARKRGFAVAICHPKKQTFQVLHDWLKDLPDNDVKLVHLQEVINLANAPK